MPIEQLIEILKTMRPGTIVLDNSTGIFDHRLRPSLDAHLEQYDGWLCSTLRIVSPPPQKGA